MTEDITEPPMQVERRMIIRGVKHGKDFTSVRCLYSDNDVQRSVNEMIERMSDTSLIESWQPRITGFSLEERYITPWRETTRRP